MASAWEQNQNHHLIFNQKPVIQTPSITNYQLNYREDIPWTKKHATFALTIEPKTLTRFHKLRSMETDTDSNTTPDTAILENFGHDMVGIQQLIKCF